VDPTSDVQCDESVKEFDPTLDSGERACIPPNCSTVSVPGSAVPCAIRFHDVELAAMEGASRAETLAELMPALGLTLACSCDLSEEESAITSTFSKVLNVFETTKEEKRREAGDPSGRGPSAPEGPGSVTISSVTKGIYQLQHIPTRRYTAR
jgi:hypothetical protein